MQFYNTIFDQFSAGVDSPDVTAIHHQRELIIQRWNGLHTKTFDRFVQLQSTLTALQSGLVDKVERMLNTLEEQKTRFNALAGDMKEIEKQMDDIRVAGIQ